MDFRSKLLRSLLASALSLSFGCASAQVEPVASPTWRPGTVFAYEWVNLFKGEVTTSNVQTVLSVEGNQAQLEVTRPDGTKEVRKVDLTYQVVPIGAVRCLVELLPECEGVHQLIRFPAKVGDRWKYKHGFPSGAVAGARVTWDMSAEVTRWEEVKVPAGTYRAMRIEHEGYWQNPAGSGRVEIVYWYSPEVGRVVKQVYKLMNRAGSTDTTSEVRLVKFVPPDTATSSTGSKKD